MSRRKRNDSELLQNPDEKRAKLASRPALPEGFHYVEDLNPFFTCPLCQGYFRDALTLPECLHTFCKICLHNHFAVIDNFVYNCPCCNVPVGPDPMKKAKFNVPIQTLFDKLFPQFVEEDLALRDQISAEKKDRAPSESGQSPSPSSSSSSSSSSEHIPCSASASASASPTTSSQSSAKPSSSLPTPQSLNGALQRAAFLSSASSSSSTSSSSTNTQATLPKEEITFELVPLPAVLALKKSRSVILPVTSSTLASASVSRAGSRQSSPAPTASSSSSSSSSSSPPSSPSLQPGDLLPPLAKPVLRCSSKITIMTLRKLIARKLGLAAPEQLEIMCSGEVLGIEHNLRFVRKTRWFDAGRDLELGYRIKL